MLISTFLITVVADVIIEVSAKEEKCKKCGHNQSNCYAKMDTSGEPLQINICCRCSRQYHYAKNRYTNIHAKAL